ncbi:2-succinyl-5-enolpyruvyl-6-hydroxy-3-cyclohexene- 1-carboxylate synthase [Halovibrio variabilis]|uniref:2-succinyl-5-enolpyruvyl-6-hydroxy-3-cyclohexene-1-carboxylate synthase n=1 Tax=Halovibrio variabilis TaxID=31910 RepID=A0A511USM1_9GAMM|nr:thiamine pyrophosphate-binding protein [Halovibrio variabilis]GEN29584.1 2-succinyl-5-enolpyruvyl-6-hydroxy-3-cyclohexene- 1-carboxylate synthase [Halovibrio variabilis]
MSKFYTDDRNVQILVALLKAHGIRKIVASPGTTNMALVGSCQHDPWFEMYSCVDERSAAYMACGLAAESEEPVVLTCTGATASRNYFPGLTEAYYRKLPILAITFFDSYHGIGNLVPQMIDRSVSPKDTVRYKVELPPVKDEADFKFAELKLNTAILELRRNGGRPVHVNLENSRKKFTTKELPPVRIINRITRKSAFPAIPSEAKRIAVYICSHSSWTESQIESLDAFCQRNNAVVFCDHTSGYKGKYRMMFSLVATQDRYFSPLCRPDLLIHIGEMSGDYTIYGRMSSAKEVWRVNEDGEVRDTFGKLRYIYEMDEQDFFDYYTKYPVSTLVNTDEYLQSCISEHIRISDKIPELPFSNIWIAKTVAPRIPEKSFFHFGVSNTMRSWTFFDVPRSVSTNANVGGRGIDGMLSSLIGASLVNSNALHFGVLGDLTFFYDMNSLGNRHVGKNLRILLVNNGRGTEFRLYMHPGQKMLGNEADSYVAAAGHFGNQSPDLVKNYVTALGFEYLHASNKTEFTAVIDRFLTPEITDKPMLLEVFTDSQDESDALETLRNLEVLKVTQSKDLTRRILGKRGVKVLKKVLGK